MTEQTVLLRRASRAPSSWNASARTFEATLSTGAAVTRMDARGAFDEVLSLSQQWPASVPLLDAHNRDSVGAVLGTVSNIRVENGQLVGLATLSKHGELAQRIAAELSDGGTFAVSIGYRVGRWIESKTADGKRAKVAEQIQLLEASLVPIAADAAAGIRGEIAMDTPTPTPTPSPAPAPVAETRASINAAIRSLGEVAGLTREWCDGQIDAEASIDEARREAFEEMKKRGGATRGVRTATVGFSGDDPEFRRAAMAEALFTRSNPSHQPTEPARAFVGYALRDCAADLLRARGVSTMGLSAAGVIDRAMSMTTSDFSLLMQDVMGKELRQSYNAAPSGIKACARMATAPDFRARHKIMVSGPLTLEAVGEHGEFRSGAFAEGEEVYKLSTFGKIVSFSRQSIINDSLGGLSDPARHLGRAAAEFEASALVALLQTSAVMSDGKTPFHTDHGNLAGSGTAIDETNLSAGRLALRTQRGLSGEPISVTPKFLVCGPALETASEKMLHVLSAVTVDDVNPFGGSLTLVIEPRISDKSWYLAASPNEIDGLEFAHLEGEGGPQVVSEVGFDTDSVRFRVRLDWGGGWIDHRGWFKNPGVSP